MQLTVPAIACRWVVPAHTKCRTDPDEAGRLDAAVNLSLQALGILAWLCNAVQNHLATIQP